MKIILQRVQSASVSVDKEVIGSIQHGLLIFIGLGEKDNRQIVDKMITKIINLRIFDDEQGKTNLSIQDVNGEMLLVSQFTLYADCRKGNRPSFTQALGADSALELYHYFVEAMKKSYENKVEMGKFGADMKISLLNDGPFTIILDSQEMNFH